MLGRIASVALASLVLVSFAVHPAHADWPASGIVLNDLTLSQTSSSWYGSGPCELLREADGSLTIVSSPTASLSNFSWTVGRVSANGDSLPGWPRQGVRILSTLTGYEDSFHGFLTTAEGTSWYASTNGGNPRLQRLTPVGGVEPIVSPFYWIVGNSGGPNAAVAPGSVGDVYVSWNRKVQRIRDSGAIATGWPAAGLAVNATGFRSDVVADGAGGAFVLSWFIQDRPLLSRVDSTAALHSGWPVGGLPLCSATAFAEDGTHLRHPLVRSDANHLMALWCETSQSGRLRLQRVSFDGQLDPAFGADGLLVEAADTLNAVTMFADGGGGVWLCYEHAGQPRFKRVREDGVIAADFCPLDGAAVYSPQTFRGNQVIRGIACDLAPDGGVFFAWSDLRRPGYEQVRWRRFTPDGAPHAAEPDTGRIVWATPIAQAGLYVGNTRAIKGDGAGGVYVLRDLGVPVALHHEVPYATLGVTPPAAPRAGLLLRAPAPNPARDAITLRFTLPDARRAALTLFDVAGRAVRTASAEGAGEHVTRWDDAEALSPGLYLAQLRQGAETRTARVVVTR